jgi:hypothetical protein
MHMKVGETTDSLLLRLSDDASPIHWDRAACIARATTPLKDEYPRKIVSYPGYRSQ